MFFCVTINSESIQTRLSTLLDILEKQIERQFSCIQEFRLVNVACVCVII